MGSRIFRHFDARADWALVASVRVSRRQLCHVAVLGSPATQREASGRESVEREAIEGTRKEHGSARNEMSLTCRRTSR